MNDDSDQSQHKNVNRSTGKPRRFIVDEYGNVQGVVHTVDAKNLSVFTDDAITDPSVLAKFKKRTTS